MSVSKNLADNPLRDAALTYADRGWPVFPLRGKIPLKDSHGFQDATLDPSQIHTSWNGTPYNIGLATGSRSGIFVLDIDPDNGGNETLVDHEMTYGALPETPQVITGSGGVHYYFIMPDLNLSISSGKLGIGIDTRGNGGYVVLPPSIHPSTKRQYTWEILHDIDDIPLASVPQWIIDLLQTSDKLPPVTSDTTLRAGERHMTLFRHGCRLRQFGYSELEILAFITAMNADRCIPPVRDEDLRHLANQSAKYQPGQPFKVYSNEKPLPMMTGKKEEGCSSESPSRVKRVPASVLTKKTFSPLKWFAAGLIHEGNVIFAGKSKRGKSWIALNIAVSLATGEDVFGHYEVPNAVKVAYCALEDGERRVNRRLLQMAGDQKDLSNLDIIFDMPNFKEGGVDVLRELIEEGFQTVIIDVLAKVEGQGKNGPKDYLEAYETFAPLVELRNEQTFSLIMITHMRKAEAQEMIDSVMGSAAYVGAQDVVWTFNRRYGENFGYLEISDKDMPEKVAEIEFKEDSGLWVFVGEGDEHAASKEESEIINYLREEIKPQSISQIMQGIGVPQGKFHSFRKRLQRMVLDSRLLRTDRGLYAAFGPSAWEKLDTDDLPY